MLDEDFEWVEEASEDEWWCEDAEDAVCIRRSYAAVASSQERAKKLVPAGAVVLSPDNNKADRLVSLKKPNDDDDAEEDAPLRFSTKTLAKNGLVKRAGDSWRGAEERNAVVVMFRPRQKDGLVATTPLDALAPELLTGRPATLNKGKRWRDVRDELERLVRDGAAAVLPARTRLERGLWSSEPQTVLRYEVKATGFSLRSGELTANRRNDNARDRTVHRYVRRQLVPWYELSTEVPAAIVAAREKRDRALLEKRRSSSLESDVSDDEDGDDESCSDEGLLHHQTAELQPATSPTKKKKNNNNARKKKKTKQQRKPSNDDDDDDSPLFEAVPGTLRAPPKRCPLSKRERRAFAPSVGKAVANVRAAANGVTRGAVELHFARRVFVTFVTLSGKIHDTVRVEDTREDVTTERRYRDGRIVSPTRGKPEVYLGLEGTDEFCTRVTVEARVAADWVNLGEFAGPASGPDEVAHALDDTPQSSHRDGVGGVVCTGLRFKGLAYQRSPALRVGAYGCEDWGASRRRQLSSSSSSPGGGDDDDVVIYELRQSCSASDDARLSSGRAQQRAKLLQKYALKPRCTSGPSFSYSDWTRHKQRILIAKDIAAERRECEYDERRHGEDSEEEGVLR